MELLQNLRSVSCAMRDMETLEIYKNYLKDSIRHLTTLGITKEDLNNLKVIHVAGTKGKGSTCAFVESILRHKGYKTGFFSSPHMIDVRERIRLNSKPISKEKFEKVLTEVYHKIALNEKPKPYVSLFTAVLAFKVFIDVKVDVAVVETVLGGEYDCTNVFSSPVVCAISSICFDHTAILGHTLSSIAWHKAGIFKPGVAAVTVPQREESLNVIVERAKQIGCPLYIAKRLPICHTRLGIKGKVQETNASLALQLAHIWMRMSGDRELDATPFGEVRDLDPISLTPSLTQALENCTWPGRFQVMWGKGVTYYVDGAHTEHSIREAVNWFEASSAAEAQNFKGRVMKVAMFNITGDRNPANLLRGIVESEIFFQYIIFCPNMHDSLTNLIAVDLKKPGPVSEADLKRCLYNKAVYECMKTTFQNLPKNFELSSIRFPSHSIHYQNTSTISLVMPSIRDALVWITNNSNDRFSYSSTEVAQSGLVVEENCSKNDNLLVQLLVTGSLYLVGGVMRTVQFDECI